MNNPTATIDTVPDTANTSAAAQAVVEDLFRRCGLKEPVGDTRKFARRPWNAELNVVIQDHDGNKSSRREVRVQAVDLSRNGFSFAFKYMIHAESRVMVRFHMLPDQPTLTGIVRHCRHTGGATHHVGVEFD